ncbi:MAG: aldehyde ferredoxin oxidoreductase [Deltaproteobacteria bacterium HGW-Deltaproteobacteria-21]|nr:MAG: aldehyde ferredoxin oxidoreductase [Deltaproteobacteria bacterium HGW-Deltaproteobacteria-21]
MEVEMAQGIAEKGTGTWGRVLHVNLTGGSHEYEQLGEEVYGKYLGGLGIGAKTLWDRMKPGIDPLGPENILGFTTGVLTDAGTLFTGRFMVVGKSPLSGGWGDSNCGGYFAPFLKRCGIDGLFLHGASERPVYLYLDDNKVEIREASDLWGLDALETEKRLKAVHGKTAQVACIGPAGENLCRFAGICNDGGRYAGRSGLGAVMGAKKLKAVVAAGKKRIGVADREEIRRLTREFKERLASGRGVQRFLGDRLFGFVGWMTRKGPVYTRQPADLFRQILKKYGTGGLTALSAESGDSPIRNWEGVGHKDFPLRLSQRIGAEALIKYETRKYGCFSCPIRCGGIMRVPDGPYPLDEMHKPEYETVCGFGSLVLNDDMLLIYKLNDLCNRGGVDTISCAGVAAFAGECFEKGILTQADTGGLELRWGNGQPLLRLVEMIVNRQGIGDVLAEGVKIAAGIIGRGAEKYAVQVGGVEPPMHDPKFDPGFAPVYYCDPTPGRHTTAAYTYLDLQLMEKKFKRAVRVPSMATHKQRHTYSGAAESLAVNVMYKMVLDGAGACLFGASVGGPMPICEWLNAATGWDLPNDEYLVMGERIQQLRNGFNIREGIHAIRDCRPHGRIWGDPPLLHGPARNVTVDIDTMGREYYAAFGWDETDGRPSRQRLQELGMEDLIEPFHPTLG